MITQTPHNKKRILFYSLIFLLFGISIIIRISTIKEEDQSSFVNFDHLYQKNGIPVVTQTIQSKDYTRFYKTTGMLNNEGLIVSYLPKSISANLVPETPVTIVNMGTNQKGIIMDKSNTPNLTTGLYRVMIKPLKNLSTKNTIVHLLIHTDTIKNAIVIPSHLIEKKNNLFYVWKEENSVAKQQIITPEANYDNITIIKKGLKPDDTIITEGNTRIFENAKLNTVERKR